MLLAVTSEWMYHLIFQITLGSVGLFLVLLILVQRGRGGGLAGALGGMGGQSAFGTKAGDMFTRVTVVVAACWILLGMAAIKVLGKPSNRFAGAGGATVIEPTTPGGATQGTTTDTKGGSIGSGDTDPDTKKTGESGDKTDSGTTDKTDTAPPAEGTTSGKEDATKSSDTDNKDAADTKPPADDSGKTPPATTDNNK